VNNELAVLQAVFSYARHLRTPHAQLEIKRLPVREKSRLLVWSTENVQTLMQCCAEMSPAVLSLVTFLANTGARRGEALALRWMDVDLPARMIRITPSADWQPKSGRAREIPISDDLYDVLIALPRVSEYVFTTITGSPYAFWPKLQFDRARTKAELRGGPHTLRHTFASHFLKTEPDLFLLARVLGHSDTRVTKLYSHLLPEHLARARNAVRFAPPVASTSAAAKAAARWRKPCGEITVAAETVPGTVRGPSKRPRRA
jgi:integrase